MSSVVVIYAFYNKNKIARENLEYFFKYGYIPSVTYYLVINEDKEHESNRGIYGRILPSVSNIKILFRPNEGYDFGGYCRGIEEVLESKQSYDYFFFLNASAIGPLDTKVPFFEKFQKLLKNNVKLVGPTINITTWKEVLDGKPCLPHVQSYTFMVTNDCLSFLWESGLFQRKYSKYLNIVKYQEIDMSTLVLRNGWNISCLVPEYQNKDYSKVWFDFNPTSVNGDIMFPGGRCFGRDIGSQEVIFMKSNRGMVVSRSSIDE